MFYISNVTCHHICFHTTFQQQQGTSCPPIRFFYMMALVTLNCNFILLMTQKTWCVCRFTPSTHFAPTSSRSLRASYFRSEPIDIHLNNLSFIKNTNKKVQQKNGWWLQNAFSCRSSYKALCLPCCQFSQINPATVRPLPTPAPSPMKKPALAPVGRWWRCLCHTRM